MEGNLDKFLRRLYKNEVSFAVFFRTINNKFN